MGRNSPQITRLKRKEWLAAAFFSIVNIGAVTSSWLYFGVYFDDPLLGILVIVLPLVNLGFYLWMRSMSFKLYALGQKHTARTYYWWSMVVALAVFVVLVAVTSGSYKANNQGWEGISLVLTTSYIINGIILAGAEFLFYQLMGFRASYKALAPNWRRLLLICWIVAAVGVPPLVYGLFTGQASYYIPWGIVVFADNMLGAYLRNNMQAYGGPYLSNRKR